MDQTLHCSLPHYIAEQILFRAVIINPIILAQIFFYWKLRALLTFQIKNKDGLFSMSPFSINRQKYHYKY